MFRLTILIMAGETSCTAGTSFSCRALVIYVFDKFTRQKNIYVLDYISMFVF